MSWLYMKKKTDYWIKSLPLTNTPIWQNVFYLNYLLYLRAIVKLINLDCRQLQYNILITVWVLDYMEPSWHKSPEKQEFLGGML